MKKQSKKETPKSSIKKLQLDKTVISNFEAKKVKGGLGEYNTLTACFRGICGSDKRYKQNIRPILDSLSKLGQITGVYYHWRIDEFPEKGFGPERQVGVIAQEVEAVLPEIVHTDEAGYKSVRYDLMTALLIEGVKSQQAQIETLQAQNEKMQKQLDHIQTTMARLKVERKNFNAAWS